MGFAALLSAFALMASGPAEMTLAQADAPAPAQAPITTDTGPGVQASADAAANGEEPYPTGAPTDDYGFMAWCYGALSGHLSLYDRVLPEVRRIEAEFPDAGTPIDKVMQGYSVQHTRGERLLLRYDRALEIQESQGKTGGVDRAAAVAKGRDLWSGSETADTRQLAQLWMSWALPSRCQATALRLAPGAPAN